MQMKLQMSTFTLPNSVLPRFLAIGDDQTLHLLTFVDCEDVDQHLLRLSKRASSPITEGTTEPILLIQKELNAYLKGTLKEFKTPLCFAGTPFQQAVWDALRKIPYGQTCSYKELALAAGNVKAHRAAAQANHVNPFIIIVPCHRVIYADGSLGGYAGGLSRKEWLITHEKRQAHFQE